MCQYTDRFLQHIVQLPSYIRDSGHILRDYHWENQYMWASLDVCSLYTSIKHQGWINHFLCTKSNTNSQQANFLVDSTKFCLEPNYFVFQGKFYLQTKGTAMGTSFAPCYANITMGFWKEQFVWYNNPFAKHIVFYGRYIDNVLSIWDGSPDFLSFVNHCNANDMGPSFTHVIDLDRLVFLDLEQFHDAGSIHTSNHSKSVSGNSYLHFDS